jgi:hypothetical protein
MSKFKNPMYVFPDLIKVGSKNNIVSFFYGPDLKKDDIEQVFPGCGCTADVQILDDRITANYTDNTSPLEIEGASASNAKPIEKSLTVVYKSEEPLWTKNERGLQVVNPNKNREILKFYGNVTK